MGGLYVSLPRGDLAELIFNRIQDRVETIFDDEISTMAEGDSSIRVSFASGIQRELDLVVGADGLHSRVRELTFGPEDRLERFLGFRRRRLGLTATSQGTNWFTSCTPKWGSRSPDFRCATTAPCFCSHLPMRIRSAGMSRRKRPCCGGMLRRERVGMSRHPGRARPRKRVVLRPGQPDPDECVVAGARGAGR